MNVQFCMRDGLHLKVVFVTVLSVSRKGYICVLVPFVCLFLSSKYTSLD